MVITKKKNSCTKGYSCGLTCINVKLKCRKDGLKGQFITLTDEYFKKAIPAKKENPFENYDFDIGDDISWFNKEKAPNLSENQVKSYIYWSSSGYKKINKSLINKQKQDDKSEAAKYYMEEGWDKAPKMSIKAPLYRGVDYLPEEVVNKYKNNVGKEITEDIYFATSYSESTAGGFGEIYNYYVEPKEDSSGREMDAFKQYYAEDEVLYKPGTKFIVEGYNDSNPYFVKIYLREV